MWCGYTCPQTVWTDLMIAVERYSRADRNARLKLDKHPWEFETIWKTATHVTWLFLSPRATRVFYFADAPTLAEAAGDPRGADDGLCIHRAVYRIHLPFGGIARRASLHLCAVAASRALCSTGIAAHLLSYVAWRATRSARPVSPGRERGDCIDCRQCVAVCPTGIDIRDGPQMECIQCALCIDACDDIMEKVGRLRGLIAYDTVRDLEAGETSVALNLFRATQVILYAAKSHCGGECDHADCARGAARTRRERTSGPQSALCAAVRRRRAQRLHHQAA
ncbi:MAG: 4Fe-4S dicluster domain-containing protein [Hyphomicrobiales bacterium]